MNNFGKNAGDKEARKRAREAHVLSPVEEVEEVVAADPAEPEPEEAPETAPDPAEDEPVEAPDPE